MLNFTYCNPTKIVFGRNQITGLKDLIPEGAHVLFTYGGGSAERFGTLDAATAALPGRKITRFGGIEPNPEYRTLMKAVRIIREERIDFVLAIGGGSVMDGTKFIALAASYEGDDHHSLLFNADKREALTGIIPFGFILTLPATGSEMNPTGVINYDGGKFAFASPKAYPLFSILDPEVTMTLPKQQVANGIVDTYVHVLEQYLTYPAEGRFQDRTAEGILITLTEIAKQTLEYPEDYDARANLVWCSTMGLNGLIGAGVPQDWSTHMIGHELTARFGIDHARSLAAILPALLQVRKEKKHDKLVQYGKRVFGLYGEDERIIDEAISRTAEFFASLGIPTDLGSYEITGEGIDDIVRQLEDHGMTGLSETGDLTPEVARQIMEASL